jgi:hypothetical protein
MTPRSKRSGDSPCPDAPSAPAKRAKTNPSVPATPRKSQHAVRNGLTDIGPRVSSAQVYEAYVDSHAADLLKQAPNEGEYCVGLEYFWAQLFMQSRDYNPEEREKLFRQTMPLFAGEEGVDIESALANSFEDVFNSYQAFFLERISAYSTRWLESDCGKDWAEAREAAM